MISLIITTYNRPKALAIVLEALISQSNKDFEIIIADDGSREETRNLIEYYRTRIKQTMHHCWQEDDGFRAARIRNKAVALSKGDYLIFLDGDCVPRSNFIAKHQSLRERGFFVFGQRVLLSEEFTAKLEDNPKDLATWSIYLWRSCYQKGECNKWTSLLPIPLGSLRKWRKRAWQGAKTCNLAVARSDFLKVNGFDERFKGWGFEDSDLVVRLIRIACYRKNGRFKVPVFHLWHRENDRSQLEHNFKKLLSTQTQDYSRAEHGLDNHMNLQKN